MRSPSVGAAPMWTRHSPPPRELVDRQAAVWGIADPATRYAEAWATQFSCVVHGLACYDMVATTKCCHWCAPESRGLVRLAGPLVAPA